MTLRIEYMALTDLLGRFHPDNPKAHDLGAIIQSLQMFGYVSPGAIDECSGLFVEGHGRTQATHMMKQQQMKVPDRIEARPDDWFLPVVRGIEFDTPEKVRAYLIASNRLTELGGWNEPALAELLQELAATDTALLESTGYDGDKLDELLRDLGIGQEPTPDPGAQIDRAAELQEIWQVERGQIWEVPSMTADGCHRVMCGDSTCEADVARLMGGAKADAVVTDPPYGVNIDYGLVDDSPKNIRNLIPRFMKIAFSFDCPIAITSGVRLLFDYPSPDWIMAWIHPAGTGRGPWGFTTFNPILIYGKDPYLANGMGSRGDSIVLAVGRDGENIHPVTKPLAVWIWLIKRVSIKRHDIILDLFLGSGTTIAAVEQTGRIGRGMEISPPYVSVSLQRLTDMGLTPRLTNGR